MLPMQPSQAHVSMSTVSSHDLATMYAPTVERIGIVMCH